MEGKWVLFKKRLLQFSTFACSGYRETSAEGTKNTGVSGLKPIVDDERRRKGKRQASSSVPTGKGQTDDKRSKSLEARPATGAKILCFWGARCRKSSCDGRHPPVCRNYKYVNRCIHGNNCLYRHADGEEKPSKRSKSESTQRTISIPKEKKGPKLCISKFRSKEVYSAESWANEIERFGGTCFQILRTHLVRSSNSGKKRVSRRCPKR